jgi:hypothetical protein
MSRLTRSVRKLAGYLRGERGATLPRLIEGMQRLHDVLAPTSLAGKMWINGGVLLGYIREGGPLAHETDVDFSYWEADAGDVHAAMPRLLAAGFRRYARWTNNEAHVTEWSLLYRGIKFEFFEMHRCGNRMRWYCYGGNPCQELLNEAPLHGLEPFEMAGRRWLKPDDHEAYLTALYGDWRIPNPAYCYATDSRAIIRRRIWTGDRRW